MKYGKQYSVLLPTFPESWREAAVSYSQLKKLINGVASELALLGLDPAVLHHLLQDKPAPVTTATGINIPTHPSPSVDTFEGSDGSDEALEADGATTTIHRAISESIPSSSSAASSFSANAPAAPLSSVASQAIHAVYELTAEGDAIIPRLRLTVPFGHDRDSELAQVSADEYHPAILTGRDQINSAAIVIPRSQPKAPLLDSVTSEIVIPLPSDESFYALLLRAVNALEVHHRTVQEDFTRQVQELADGIASHITPRQTSSSSTPSVPFKGKWTKTFSKDGRRKGEIAVWREIFQLWMDSAIFESASEQDRGERSLEEVERRMAGFVERVGKLEHVGQSVDDAIGKFMQLNALLLDLKKFDHANSEALRKIMKKHEKRTALMLSSTPRLPPPSTPGFESISPTTMTSHPLFVTLLREGTAPGGAMLHPGMMGPVAGAESKLMKHGLSLPHLLVVVLTETLLPVIPSIDDYSCMICFSLAYIPIRLQCRHLFCVRCLSKMQRQGKENCPLCRAPTVLHANRENVDTALQQFMLTWFPAEARAKDKANREEKAREEAIELGYGEDGAKSCIVM